MALNRLDLARVASASTGAHAMWLYKTDDDLLEVLTPQYFGQVAPQLRDGDLICLQLSLGYNWLSVITSNPRQNLVVIAEIDFGLSNLMQGFFDPDIVGGDLVPFIINGTDNYQTDQYVIARNAGIYDFDTGQPSALGTSVETGDRILYSDTQLWYVLGEPISQNRGFMNPTLDDGVPAPFQVINFDVSGNYQPLDYLIASQSGFYDFDNALGFLTPEPGTTEVISSSRVLFDGSNWIVFNGSAEGLMKGWFNPNVASGGPLVDFPIVDGTTDYDNRQWVQCIEKGTYDISSGLPSPLGTAYEPGDILRWDGVVWILEHFTNGLMRGFMEADQDGGGPRVPWVIENNTDQYLVDEYVIVDTPGMYDFVTGLTGSGTNLTIGDRLIYNGATWDIILGPGNSNTVIEPVNQPGHGFALGANIYKDAGGLWQYALSNNENTLKQSMVASVIDIDNFMAVSYGEILDPGHGLTVGATYFLSGGVPGGNTELKPNTGFIQATFEVIDIDHIKVLDQAVGLVVDGSLPQPPLVIQAVDVIQDPVGKIYAIGPNVQVAIDQLDAAIADVTTGQPIATGNMSGSLVNYTVPVPVPGDYVPLGDPSLVAGNFINQTIIDINAGEIAVDYVSPSGGDLVAIVTAIVNITETSGGTDELRFAFTVNGNVAPNSIVRWNQASGVQPIVTINETVTGFSNGDVIGIVATTLGTGNIAISSLQFSVAVWDLGTLVSGMLPVETIIPDYSDVLDYKFNEAVVFEGVTYRSNQVIAVPEAFNPNKWERLRTKPVALDYDATQAIYVQDEMVVESGLLYRNITPIAVPEAFDPLKWEVLGGAVAGDPGQANTVIFREAIDWDFNNLVVLPNRIGRAYIGEVDLFPLNSGVSKISEIVGSTLWPGSFFSTDQGPLRFRLTYSIPYEANADANASLQILCNAQNDSRFATNMQINYMGGGTNQISDGFIKASVDITALYGGVGYALVLWTKLFDTEDRTVYYAHTGFSLAEKAEIRDSSSYVEITYLGPQLLVVYP